jgi:hypothetical protein
MRDRISERYRDFVAFPGLTFGVVIILVSGWLNNAANLEGTQRLQATGFSIEQHSKVEQDSISHFEDPADCADGLASAAGQSTLEFKRIC